MHAYMHLAFKELSYPYYVAYNGYHKCTIAVLYYMHLKTNVLLTAYSLCIVFGVYLCKKHCLLGPTCMGGRGASSAPPYPMAGWEGCPPLAPSPGRWGNHRYWPLHFIFPSYATALAVKRRLLSKDTLLTLYMYENIP